MASIIRKPLNLTAAVRFRLPPLFPFSGSSGSVNSDATRCSEMIPVPSLVEGCDYKHWLVLMKPPNGYPPRDHIVQGFVRTLAMALGSEEEAKKSIYSVSTKYYYAFGCRVHEPLTNKIRSLPDVRWVLPDSFIVDGDNRYGGLLCCLSFVSFRWLCCLYESTDSVLILIYLKIFINLYISRFLRFCAHSHIVGFLL
ncbi:multiple organellar RNA editing factor 7, mitochondrial isoform X1 [Capsella rubella]|uniref:multiple organellar RNA editing factor 7, mitochondrial isoform X1 n=1 Tax=Capsella rubella TaxID=81985 RepID=UPI000CD4CD55|nr:multiple organellar RNA editing factor 7, mitochondrial isoform X1 [Capsella rubella]